MGSWVVWARGTTEGDFFSSLADFVDGESADRELDGELAERDAEIDSAAFSPKGRNESMAYGLNGFRAVRRLVAFCIVVLCCLPTGAEAAEGPPAEEPGWEMFPAGEIYPRYHADPRGPDFGLMQLFVTDPDVPESGRGRVALKLGGRFGLVRIRPAGAPERPWQISIEAGFYGQFDQAHSLDNIGWDGIYGFLLTRELEGGAAVKLGTMHVSSHVGDEYAERIGRRRLNYTREELVAGVSWPFARGWRTYAEGAWGYVIRTPEIQAPGRVRWGIELERPGVVAEGRWGVYAAADFDVMEEQGWRPDASINAGLLVPSSDRRWRMGVGYYHGRVPIGEFVMHREPFFVMGLWLDL
jgi:hypothetical protein